MHVKRYIYQAFYYSFVWRTQAWKELKCPSRRHRLKQTILCPDNRIQNSCAKEQTHPPDTQQSCSLKANTDTISPFCWAGIQILLSWMILAQGLHELESSCRLGPWSSKDSCLGGSYSSPVPVGRSQKTGFHTTHSVGGLHPSSYAQAVWVSPGHDSCLPQIRDSRERERAPKTRGSLCRTQSRKCHPITLAVFYSLEASYPLIPAHGQGEGSSPSKEISIKESVDISLFVFLIF